MVGQSLGPRRLTGNDRRGVPAPPRGRRRAGTCSARTLPHRSGRRGTIPPVSEGARMTERRGRRLARAIFGLIAAPAGVSPGVRVARPARRGARSTWGSAGLTRSDPVHPGDGVVPRRGRGAGVASARKRHRLDPDGDRPGVGRRRRVHGVLHVRPAGPPGLPSRRRRSCSRSTSGCGSLRSASPAPFSSCSSPTATSRPPGGGPSRGSRGWRSRWRPLVILFGPGPMSDAGFPNIDNPIGIAPLARAARRPAAHHPPHPPVHGRVRGGAHRALPALVRHRAAAAEVAGVRRRHRGDGVPGWCCRCRWSSRRATRARRRGSPSCRTSRCSASS